MDEVMPMLVTSDLCLFKSYILSLCTNVKYILFSVNSNHLGVATMKIQDKDIYLDLDI